MFRALFDLESGPDPYPNKIYRDRVFVSETWNDNRKIGIASVGFEPASCRGQNVSFGAWYINYKLGEI